MKLTKPTIPKPKLPTPKLAKIAMPKIKRSSGIINPYRINKLS